MNRTRIIAHLAGSAGFTGIWVGAVAIAPGPADWRLLAAGAIPPAVAVASLLLQWAADQHHDREAVVVSARRPSPYPREVTERLEVAR
ncbi:hypothetical protein [Micromonospora cathayae]|uniref:Uncharacterized protein n=1 Tax=Micromonospora cathayae TaxID=3028804 RepID=A0ABY7ZWA3_9ACTN|nr:hypothetical protein [Micromonospora sp. HUAS 3]WDZ87163.1 hypothetical protein PVK37_12545 [Micromonospora sp. HUAS 3]